MASISWSWQADFIMDGCRLPGETVTDHFVGPRESQIQLPRKANKSQLGTEVKKKNLQGTVMHVPLSGWIVMAGPRRLPSLVHISCQLLGSCYGTFSHFPFHGLV